MIVLIIFIIYVIMGLFQFIFGNDFINLLAFGKDKTIKELNNSNVLSNNAFYAIVWPITSIIFVGIFVGIVINRFRLWFWNRLLTSKPNLLHISEPTQISESSIVQAQNEVGDFRIMNCSKCGQLIGGDGKC